MDKKKYLEELNDLLITQNEKEKDRIKCIEYADNLIDLNLPVIFNIKHFALLVGRTVNEIANIMMNLEEYYYSYVKIPKKAGGYRKLSIPAMSLRIIQKWVLKNLLENIPVSKYAMGFCRKKSIVTNAKSHVGQNCIINLDLKDFFPSITLDQVFRVFYYYGYTINVSYMLARLCTYEKFLPQGAPTSPYISNIVCLKLDKRLSKLAEKYNVIYTRYADDITFSGDYGINKIINIARTIIKDEGFKLNDKKTRIAYKHEQQEVTGLIVSENKVSVRKKYKKKLLQEIYYCKKYGVSNHLEHIESKKRFYKDHLYGKAFFVYMVDRKLGECILHDLEEIEWES
jgi:retron-type reverse transcriptase